MLYEAGIVTGIAVGGIYALIAVGITQIYKVTRVLNLAHAGFVMWGAYLYSLFSYTVHLPAVPSAIFTLICVAGLGVLSELMVFRFAERATIANKIILTFGLLQLLTALALWVFGEDPKGATPLVVTNGFAVLNTRVGWNQLANIIAAFVVVVGVGMFLKYTRIGLLTRATAEDASMAELLGAHRARIGALNWGLAASSAGLAGIFIATMGPFTNDVFLDYFIFSVLATMVGGLYSLPLTALGGLMLGLADNLFSIANFSFGNLTIFAAIVVLALTRKSWQSDISAIRWLRGGISRDEARNWAVSFTFGVVFLAGGIALFLATFDDLVWSQTVALVLVYAVATMSLIPILGWTGQVSLATAGLMGIGGFATLSGASYYHLPLPIAFLFGSAIAAGFGLVLGLIVSRLSFVLTVIVTLAFNNIAGMFMGGQYAPWDHFGFGGPMLLLPGYLDTAVKLTLSFFVLCAILTVLVGNIRRSSWGTRFLAVKHAPVMAEHFGVRPSLTRVYAYGISGAIASVAGAMYALFLGNASGGEYTSTLSLTVLMYAVVGGAMALWGPYLGAMLFVGLPALLGLNRYGASPIPALATGVLVIVLVATSLDGLAGFARHPSESLPRWGIARRTVRRFVGEPVDVSSAWSEVLTGEHQALAQAAFDRVGEPA